MIRALFATALLLAASASAEGLHRFAVIAGNDEGGDDTRPLLYARDDARKIHQILLRLGAVDPKDAVLLLNQSADRFLTTLSDLERRAKEAGKAGERTALIVYYSGHAKNGALRLGSSALPLESLKGRLSQAPVDVRIGIFDACQSGVLTRTKGARHAPEFAIESGVDKNASGMVILTSSASTEDSQESDLIGGSYFSHHFASGLLGDADRSADGKVSLSEAYAYAYDRTVADTSESLAGAQHPTFSYDLKGNGDVVLTDLVSRTDGLVFPAAAPSGVYYLVDSRGFVAAEVWKKDAEEKRIALAAGNYRVKRRLEDRLRIGELTLAAGNLTHFDESRMRDASFSDDPVKGVDSIRNRPRWSVAGKWVRQGFFDSQTQNSLFPAISLMGMETTLKDFVRRDWNLSLEVLYGAGARGTVQLKGLPLRFTSSQMNAGATVSTDWPMGDFIPFAGGRLAMMLITREFPDQALPGHYLLSFSPGLTLGAHWNLGSSWQLTGTGRLNSLLYNVDGFRVLPYWEFSVAVSYGH